MPVRPPLSLSEITRGHAPPSLGPADVRALALLPLALLAVLAALGGRSASADDPAASSSPESAEAAFGEAFAASSRLTLEEPDSALVASVAGIDVRKDGVTAVADPKQDRVRIYARDGGLLADLGGSGSGPGELDGPGHVAFDDRGGLYVAQVGTPRVTRFTRDFAYDTAFRVDSAYAASEIAVTEEGVLVFANRPRPGAEGLRIYDGRGAVERTFHPRRRAYRTVPYWNAAADRLLAASPSHLVAGGNLLYPFVRYSPAGVLRDSIGTPPESWEQPPRPERGAFTGPDQRRQFEKWRRTFTTVQNLVIYRDSLLVVSHEELDPEILAYEDATYRADVYRIQDGRKLLEDVRLPGRLLEGGRHLHLLLSSPPAPWTLGRFRIRTGGLQP